jgi:hypothetical protein
MKNIWTDCAAGFRAYSLIPLPYGSGGALAVYPFG